MSGQSSERSSGGDEDIIHAWFRRDEPKIHQSQLEEDVAQGISKMSKLFPGHFTSDAIHLNSSSVLCNSAGNEYLQLPNPSQQGAEKDQKLLASGICPSPHGTKIRTTSRGPKQKIPTKQEWLSFWYQDGSPKWTVITMDEKRVVYTINVHSYYMEGSHGGYGVILRDDFGRPIVASSAIYDHGPASFLFYEFQGVRGGLQHVLDCKLLAYDIELLSPSEITVEVLKLIRWKAADIVDATANSPYVWENLKSFFSFHHVEFLEAFRPLIKEISKLYVKLPDTDFDVCDVGESMNRAAEYVANLHRLGTANMTQKEELEQDCRVVKMKHGDFPVELQDILYKDAYEGTMYYSKTTIWDAYYLNT